MQRRLKFQKFELLQSGSLFAQDAAIIHLSGNIEISDEEFTKRRYPFLETQILSRDIELWVIRILTKKIVFKNANITKGYCDMRL